MFTCTGMCYRWTAVPVYHYLFKFPFVSHSRHLINTVLLLNQFAKGQAHSAAASEHVPPNTNSLTYYRASCSIWWVWLPEFLFSFRLQRKKFLPMVWQHRRWWPSMLQQTIHPQAPKKPMELQSVHQTHSCNRNPRSHQFILWCVSTIKRKTLRGINLW